MVRNIDTYTTRALAAFQAGFKTLTAKKDALGDLSRAFEGLAQDIRDLVLAIPREQQTTQQNDVYWGLPDGLHNWRPKHAALVLRVFPAAGATVALIEKLVELRSQLNAAEVAPKEPTKTEREQAIRLSATGKVYADEFGKMEPELVKDFEDYIEARFKELAGKYGLAVVQKLGAHYTHRTGRNPIPADVNPEHVETYRKTVQSFLTTASFKGGAPQLDRARLSQKAKAYAKLQIDQFVVKLTQKLGDLTEVKIRWADAHGFECVIEGKLRGHSVVVRQSRKFVVNQQGTAFHQWPALIYVDGKFTTEAAFKRLVVGG